jgi:hypothetical protein
MCLRDETHKTFLPRRALRVRSASGLAQSRFAQLEAQAGQKAPGE